MNDLAITHTHEAGTLIDGTAKGDASVAILKANCWRWGRSIGAWFIPQSRDRFAKMHLINTTAAQLREIGYTVTIDIDDQPRPAVVAEAAKAAQFDARAEALATKAERREAQADAADNAARAAHNRLPEGGEPIKVGHHSEKRHRAAIQRAHRTQGRAIEAHEAAALAAYRAEIAASANDRRNNPTTVANRIAGLEAELRKHQRELDGYTAERGTPYVREIPPAAGAHRDRVLARQAHDAEHLAYWQDVRAAQIANGTATNYSPDVIATGDQVQISKRWWATVERVNAKTVRVKGHNGLYGGLVRYSEITDHKAA